MKKHIPQHRRAIVVLLATVALPLTPALAQEAPVAVTPSPVTATPPGATTAAPPVVRVTPPPVTSAPAPVATTPPVPVAPTIARPPVVDEEPVIEEEAAPPPRASRTAPRTRAVAPVAPAAPVDAPPVEADSMAPIEAAPIAPPPVADPAPPVAEAAPVEPVAANETPTWPWAVGAAASLIAAVALFAIRRRRRLVEEEAYYDDPLLVDPLAEPVAVEPDPFVTSPQPTIAPAPVASAAVAPVAAAAAISSVESAAVTEAEAEDIEAMAAASEPDAGRPWLEFMMRPVRAGTNDQDAVVEFDLTVGNTGSVPARDVRISSWMIAAGSPQESEMERMLIEPPADAKLSRVSIEPGDATRVEAAVALPRSALRGSVLPVVVADARYTLPDGTEGRTSASFAVGLPSGEGLEPFALDMPSGLHEGVEARLHGEPERV